MFTPKTSKTGLQNKYLQKEEKNNYPTILQQYYPPCDVPLLNLGQPLYLFHFHLLLFI